MKTAPELSITTILILQEVIHILEQSLLNQIMKNKGDFIKLQKIQSNWLPIYVFLKVQWLLLNFGFYY
uniref:Uncharacterized protein n=1 Tax=Meloidogyne enterolobii TaxID=390850 RepID=A0A6V7WJ46_MELEN|nr:unnamed protein product [Meloidogyne enterolobii]